MMLDLIKPELISINIMANLLVKHLNIYSIINILRDDSFVAQYLFYLIVPIINLAQP